jgi:hypothetical protein
MDFGEIYTSRAEDYDALVRREDAARRLWTALDRLVDWTGADVCELGAGTGRVTTELAARCASVQAFDRSPSMLRVARQTLGTRSRADVAPASPNIALSRSPPTRSTPSSKGGRSATTSTSSPTGGPTHSTRHSPNVVVSWSTVLPSC